MERTQALTEYRRFIATTIEEGSKEHTHNAFHLALTKWDGDQSNVVTTVLGTHRACWLAEK